MYGNLKAGENGVGGNAETRIPMIIGTVQVWFIRCWRIQLINRERELLWIKKIWLKGKLINKGVMRMNINR